MNLDKADVKIGAATEIGARIEDVLEGYRKEALRQEGASQAFHQVAKACEELAKHVDKDLDEGKLTAEGPLEIAAHIKRYTDRCANAARNLAKQSEGMQFIAAGRVSAMEASVKLVDKFRQEEISKIQTLRAALANGANVAGASNGAVVDTETGALRPGMSIKERRLAEERAAAASESKVAATAPVAEELEAEEKPAAKKRGRPPKKR